MYLSVEFDKLSLKLTEKCEGSKIDKSRHGGAHLKSQHYRS
jgi:hypothetical protein